MGYLIDGKWHTHRYDTKSTGGRFKRKDASFRNWITRDGSPGPSGAGGFKAEANRYHLYISHACPWAHRTVIYRKLKGLEDIISLSAVNAFMGDEGWTFEPGDGVIPDPVLDAKRVYQIYQAADSEYTGRASVPVLWDKHIKTIVSNESSEIIRMFDSTFDEIGARTGHFYPPELADEIDELNHFIYPKLNNGVYRSGFATTQEAYEEAVNDVFEALNTLEERLSGKRYLTGDRITEADWRLFTTLVRFDPVYVGHFKCNRKRIIDYPNLWAYLRDLYQQPGIAETVYFDYIKNHYYGSHESINPTRVVPAGPNIDFNIPHGRD